MAGAWEGFTEEDIGYYYKINEDTNEKIVPKKKATNLQSVGKKKNNAAGEGILIESQNQSPKTENEIREGGRSCKEPRDERVPLMDKGEEKGKVEGEKPAKEHGPGPVGSNPVCLKVLEGKGYELLDKNPADVSKATLEVFEARQKMLEEQNKKRKEMLAKVISARKKQTTEEAKRLHHIQEELQKLDLRLSNDVGILRDKIEEASLDFVEAQKRYNKAEKEFLEAKQSLFVKMEKKELLTKLLCTIIEQNEVRKAQKLSELMEKLEIDDSGLNGNSAQSSVIITSDGLRALNEATKKGKDVEPNKPKQPS